jgi:hypothetical protein
LTGTPRHYTLVLFAIMRGTAEKAALEDRLKKGGPDQLDVLERLARIYEHEGTTSWGGDRRSKKYAGTADSLKPASSAVAKLAKLTGDAPRTIRRKLLIAKTGTPKLKTAMASGQVSQNQATLLLSLSASEQDEQVERLIAAAGGASRRRAVGTGTKQDARRKVEEDPDFVNVKAAGYSLSRLEEMYPGGCPPEVIAEALMVTPDEVDRRYQRIVATLKKKMKA